MARTPPKMDPIKGKRCTVALIKKRRKKNVFNLVRFIVYVRDFFTETMALAIVELLLCF